MGIQLGIGLTGQRVNASPARLFGVSGSRGFMFDLSDYSTQFQDTAGTTPITTTAQSLGLMLDLSQGGSFDARRNLINLSEQADNAAWVKTEVSVTANATTDPIGTTTADKVVESAAVTVNHILRSPNASIVAGAYTASVYAKAAERSWMRLRIDGSTLGVRAWFDLTNGVVGTVDSGAAATIQSVGNGWYRCTLTETANAATSAIAGFQIFPQTANAQTTYTGDGVSGIFVWGAQFEAGSTVSAYQATGASLPTSWVGNHATQGTAGNRPLTTTIGSGFRGIQFDGVDDWLQTAAIDFSNSDEVTVVAGVRKLSDAARGMLVELTNFGTGRFNIEAPGTPLNNYGAASGGSAVIGYGTAAIFPSPDTRVISMRGKISTDFAEIRQNATIAGTIGSDQGTGNYSNAIVYIGRRGGTSLPFNGVLTFLFAINRLLTANELASVEAYANARTGAF